MTNKSIKDKLKATYATYTKKSILSGRVRTRVFEVYTPEEFEKRLAHWKTSGRLIQDVFPELDASAREFIVSGITDDEWNTCILDPEDESVSQRRLNDWYE